MGNRVANSALGQPIAYYERVRNNDPGTAQLVIMLLRVAEADAVLEDHDTFADILAGGNTEADFDNYARIALDDTDLSAPTVDDVNGIVDADIPDQTWANAGGTTDNTLVKAIVGYDPLGTNVNGNIVFLGHADYTPTTNGQALVLQIAAAGLFRAQHPA